MYRADKIAAGCGGWGPVQKVAAFGGEAVVMVAAGHHHTACVTARGALWTFGRGKTGELGRGVKFSTGQPQQVGAMEVGGGGGMGRVIMVACGFEHTLVLTGKRQVWSCGNGRDGRLGLGDQVNRHELTLVEPESFLPRIAGAKSLQHAGNEICMLAGGLRHSVALAVGGQVFTWGCGLDGQLGVEFAEDNFLQRRFRPAAVDAAWGHSGMVSMVAAGYLHTAAVSKEGELWAWGRSDSGQLGLGVSVANMHVQTVDTPRLVGGAEVMSFFCTQSLKTANVRSPLSRFLRTHRYSGGRTCAQWHAASFTPLP